ncbi:hypothetical protein [Agrococcus sp. TSP3-2-1]|uniref:hypothetical protein n=1 Tax=Agrococcus sp. TSP3-2-1 TaxID=2804583 RepID=UPI003CFB2CE4
MHRQVVVATIDRMRDALPEFSVTFSSRHVAAVRSLEIPLRGEVFAAGLPAVETCLDDEPCDVGAELLGQLAFFSVLPGMPQLIGLQIAFGWAFAESHIDEMAAMAGGLYQRGLPGADLVDAFVAIGDATDARLARSFRGEAPQSADPSRVARGIVLLRRTAAHAPEGIVPFLLCIIAWLLWVIGKRAHARAYLADASRRDAHLLLVRAVDALVDAGRPSWTPFEPTAEVAGH